MNILLYAFSTGCKACALQFRPFRALVFVVFCPLRSGQAPEGWGFRPNGWFPAFYPTAFISVKVKGETPSASLVPLYKEGQLSLLLEILRFAQDDNA